MWGYIGGALGAVLVVAAVGFSILFLGFIKWVQSISEENRAEAEALDATADDLEPGSVG
ncbi:MAG: hypothetical protein Q8R35_00845 [bacterium]|nr:hypothetical protein [bacterium]